MFYGNQTLVIEFLFMCLTNSFQQQVALFLIFLFVYLVTLLGNLGMIALIWMDSWPHSPMYFFLRHLLFVDTCSSSVIGPKMLTDIFLQEKVISFFGCAAQIWFFSQFVVTECFLLLLWHMITVWPSVNLCCTHSLWPSRSACSCW